MLHRNDVLIAEPAMPFRSGDESVMKAEAADNFKWRRIFRQGGDCWSLAQFPTYSFDVSYPGACICMRNSKEF